MQLAKIKLSGFKSFVDPTTVDLPSKLIAIVGPNGCGKSNIIDAVTWVMGESSPKYLRGEASTDVIFNGSNVRKPVGQASVELIFDNSDQSIGGEYAKYAEISVKRTITRDSDSTYYLNGVRCRKRDVVDIFLGTGLGPRSYSIIGQNMINRVIEAKPDDLRVYLEEAAGISKYKERRHETELRIQHTKENLARVNDLRAELEKQLNHLKHQANVAEKYKTLKQQERILRAELYGIEWRQLDSRMVDYTLQIQRKNTAFEAKQSDLTNIDRELEQMRHEQRVSHDAFQEVQRRYYSVGNEITRIEQDILHQQERQHQWETDLTQTENEWQSIKNQMTESEDDLRVLEKEIVDLEPALKSANQDLEDLQDKEAAAEDDLQTWQSQWDEFNQHSAKTTQTVQVEQTHIQHVEQRIALLQKRQNELQQDQNRLNFSELNKEVEEFSKEALLLSDTLQKQHQQLSKSRKEVGALQVAQQDSNNQLDKIRSELQQLRGQQASLEALQQTALGQRDNPTSPWVARHQLNTKSRLAQHISVEPGWESAVEKVLGFCLQAICVDEMNDIMAHLDDFQSGNLCAFVTKQTVDSASKNSKVHSLLLQKIQSPWPLESLLAGIHVADSLEEALTLCEKLSPNESVVTRDGVWLNRSWLKILREQDPAAGVFQREQELKQLATRIDSLTHTQTELEKNIHLQHDKLLELEKQCDEIQPLYNKTQAQLAQINANKKMKEERLKESKAQSERFIHEQEEYVSQLQQAQSELSQAQLHWQQAMNDLENQTEQRETLLSERDYAKEHLQSIRHEVNHGKQKAHELELRLQKLSSQKTSLHQTISRFQAQLAALNERKITFQSELSSMPPLDTLNKSLSRALDKHVSIESELNSTRVAAESLDQEYRSLEETRQTIAKDIDKIRSSLESLRVEWQGWKVKADTLVEQIKETEFTLEDILKQLSQDATVQEWQTKLTQVVQRINRLGAINLVAIDEFATCSERKQYLDKQYDDLHSGLTTLEDAIAKIDKETKVRFKDTFDKVNERFKELFPTIFGGGKAYLELTSDNLLEAGVTAMACPPGKRNSSIYLLSGGEKSLTAIALVFSIFHLNPAPFCLLDEVDAALDDANVLRFTNLVKTMTDKTQFLFISHNKITIEMAEHLIGVTMHEPGVSRLVSVDIEKAMNLAGIQALPA